MMQYVSDAYIIMKIGQLKAAGNDSQELSMVPEFGLASPRREQTRWPIIVPPVLPYSSISSALLFKRRETFLQSHQFYLDISLIFGEILR